MKKRTLLLIAIAVLTLNSYAQKWESIRNSTPVTKSPTATAANAMVFGYSTDNIAISLGYTQNSTLMVAIRIPQETAMIFAGSKITKIHVGSGSSPTFNTSVFIAESLGTTLAYTQPATFTPSTWNVITLTTPYTITGATDVVIGYEYTTGAAFYAIGLDDSKDASKAAVVDGNHFILKQNGSYDGVWDNWTNEKYDGGFFNLALKATIEGNYNLPLYDLNVSSVFNVSDVFPNEPFSIITSIKNMATASITNFKVKYEVGNSVLEKTISGVSIHYNGEYTFSQEWSIAEKGTYPVRVTVSEPNGQADEDASNNSATGSDVAVGTTVPTTPRNRNVILEEYTGIYCTYCPDGHKRANQLKAKYPGKVEIINIHQGTFANPGSGAPDYRTQWGNALAAQTGLSGYPSGTINRHVFSGTATALNRGAWTSAANTILNQVSPVNLLAKAYVDWNSRLLTVDVEGYYTSNSSSTNMLNVALLQENILGPQTGASSLYPEMMENGLYKHNHMLRHLLTGQWGDPITVTTAGSSFSKQYTYIIPENINSVPVDLSNLTILAFIAEGNQEIITGTVCRQEATFDPAPTLNLIRLTQSIRQTNDNRILVQAIVQNLSSLSVSSYNLAYGIAGSATGIYELTGKNLQPLETDTIFLPLISVPLNVEKMLNVSVEKVNEETPDIVSQLSLKVKKDLSVTNSRSLSLKLWQDQYGEETAWNLFDLEGNIISTGGPYSKLSTATTKLWEEDLTVLGDGVYRFEIYDAYGDGINSGAGAGKYEIWANNTTLLTSDNGQFGSLGIKYITVDNSSSIKNTSISSITTYSFEDNLYINSQESIAYVAVYDMLGKQVILQNNVRDFISLKGLSKGIYIVKAITKSGEEKVIKISK
jgi:hypothetical protein